MKSDSDIQELQQVADYRIMRNTLRGSGIGSIIFGLIGVGLGISAMAENPVNAVLVVIGAFLVLEGIWIVSSPWPGGMILDGLALLAVGGWNIFCTLQSMGVGGGPGFFGILGGYQIYWAFRSFGRYGRFVHLAGNAAPSAELMGQVDSLIKGILTAKGDDAKCVVQFQDGNKVWKAKLFDTVAVLIQGNGEDMLFLDRDQVTLTAEPADRKGKQYKATFRTPERAVAGMIAPQGMAVCRQWIPARA